MSVAWYNRSLQKNDAGGFVLCGLGSIDIGVRLAYARRIRNR
jgi:hypothetical protein